LFTPQDDLDLLVNAAAMAHRLDLPKPKIQAIRYLTPRPNELDASSTYVPIHVFSRSYVYLAHPLFLSDILPNYQDPVQVSTEELSEEALES
jgi:hypothetical protein